MAEHQEIDRIKNRLAFLRGRLIDIAEVTKELAEDVKSSLVDDFKCPTSNCDGTLFPRNIKDEDGKKSKRRHFVHHKGTCTVNLETTAHRVAKQVIEETMTITLPILYERPGDVRSEPLEPKRNATWREIHVEKTVAGRWRADLLLNNEYDPPFAIIEEEGERPLVVEIVVTSRVRQDKIDAVQRAGLRMLCINLPLDVLELHNVHSVIAYDSDREWLAHPAWRQHCEAKWAREDEKRRQQEYMREQNHQRILRRIEERNAPNWEPINREVLERTVADNGLEHSVGHQTAHEHWMAGEPQWWQAALLHQAFVVPCRQGHINPTVNEQQACDLVYGYVIPLPKTPYDRLLDALGLEENSWGSASDAIRVYLSHMADEGWLILHKGLYFVPMAKLAVIGRNADVDSILQPAFQPIAGSTADACRKLDSWKSVKMDGKSRRQCIIEGGRPYQQVLSLARNEAAAIIADLLRPHDENESRPPVKPIGLVSPGAPIEEVKPRLHAVTEVLSPPEMRNPERPSQGDFSSHEDTTTSTQRTYSNRQQSQVLYQNASNSSQSSPRDIPAKISETSSPVSRPRAIRSVGVPNSIGEYSFGPDVAIRMSAVLASGNSPAKWRELLKKDVASLLGETGAENVSREMTMLRSELGGSNFQAICHNEITYRKCLRTLLDALTSYRTGHTPLHKEEDVTFLVGGVFPGSPGYANHSGEILDLAVNDFRRRLQTGNYDILKHPAEGRPSIDADVIRTVQADMRFMAIPVQTGALKHALRNTWNYMNLQTSWPTHIKTIADEDAAAIIRKSHRDDERKVLEGKPGVAIAVARMLVDGLLSYLAAFRTRPAPTQD